MHHYHAILLCYNGLPAYTVMVEGVVGREVKITGWKNKESSGREGEVEVEG